MKYDKEGWLEIMFCIAVMAFVLGVFWVHNDNLKYASDSEIRAMQVRAAAAQKESELEISALQEKNHSLALRLKELEMIAEKTK